MKADFRNIASIVLVAILGSAPLAGAETISAAADSERPLSPIRRAIDRALDRGWHTLRLVTECHQESGFATLEIHGNGVAIWDNKRQFSLAPEDIKALLTVIRDADFGAMPDAFRRSKGPAPPGLACRVILRLETTAKQVTQPTGATASEDFLKLADQLFDFARELAKKSIDAADLNDALTKLADGKLAAETLTLVSNRKPNRKHPDVEGWVINLSGNQVTTRSYNPVQGYDEPIAFTLDQKAFSELAKRLAKLQVGNMLSTLPAEHQTAVRIIALGRKREIKSRVVDPMPTEHPPKGMKQFGQLIDTLAWLHHIVLTEGRPINAPPTE